MTQTNKKPGSHYQDSTPVPECAHSVCEVLSRRQEPRKTKVRKLDLPFLVDENIASLQVPMQHALRVAVLHCLSLIHI